MAYAAFSVVFGEQPSAAKWNILGTNDASFNDGTGIADSAITPEKLLTGTGTSWPWASWTPTWANLTIGNAVVTAKYKQIGKTVIGRIEVTAGTTTSASSGAVPTFTFPVTSVSHTANFPLGQFILRGASVGSGYARWASTTTGSLASYFISGTQLADAGIHEAVGTNDILLVNFVYEAA